MPFGIGIQELLVILAIAALFFGAKRIPEVAKSLGKSIQSFKDGLKGEPDPGEPDHKA
jgi:TatA/E family protein of Tat protein translocase